jgi:uncharacterized membrane protein YeiH
MSAMEVLSSLVLLHPTDLERSRELYRDALGLAIYRELGSGAAAAHRLNPSRWGSVDG